MNRLTLALDVMGGDFGPRITMPAIIRALETHPTLSVLLCGEQSQIFPFFEPLSDEIKQRIQIIHTDKIINDNLPFLQAVRHSKNSSMRLALESVAGGKADGCVSGGNTGILMGLAKQIIAPLPQISRPALTSVIPSLSGKSSVMLDLGANVEADSELLCQFAEMGNLFAQMMLDLVYPRLALLNIGIEENKGTAEIKVANQALKQRSHLNYIGFIEGDKLMNNVADVIICDGFSGNIALKTLEGTAKNVIAFFRHSDDNSHICLKIRNAFLRVIFRRHLRKLHQINPDRHNGATLLGLSKVVVKSHGGAEANAYYYAIEHAINQIKYQVPQKLSEAL